MEQETDILRIPRDRLSRVFRYLAALQDYRNPVKRLFREQPWFLRLRDFPQHPAVRLGVHPDSAGAATGESDSSALEQQLGDDYILRVRRPSLTHAPSPTESIGGWLEEGWEDPFSEVRVIDSMESPSDGGEPKVVRFTDDSARVSSFELWKERRDEWARGEQPARETMRLFENLYELHGRMEREAERLELMVGDGMLRWRLPDGGIHHPVLLQRVQLKFDPDIPEFLVVETEHPVELYSALFRATPGVDFRGIARVREELEQAGYDPLGSTETDGFLRRLVQQLSPRGSFDPVGAPLLEFDHPVMVRDPILFLRERTLGFSAAIESILEDVSGRTDLPASLLNIVGTESLSNFADEESISPLLPGDVPDEILFGKPWNPEQVRVAERLERHGAVLVQGPPGTGKSHTIANLIGHFLAKGKSVLVTAHTTKALRVLRGHVVEQLRPLCVSVLESDLESRRQLEESVGAIVDRLSSADAGQLELEANNLRAQRRLVLKRLRELHVQLLEARAGEYRDIVVAGQGFAPSEAARKIGKEIGKHDWIPTPVILDAPLPLAYEDLISLYRTNVIVSREDETELSGALPSPEELLDDNEFAQIVQERAHLADADQSYHIDFWTVEAGADGAEELERISAQLQSAIQPIREGTAWKIAAVAAGQRGEPAREPWDQLVALIERAHACCATALETFIRYAPKTCASMSLDVQRRVLTEILRYLETHRAFGPLALLTHPLWKQFLREARIGSEAPKLPVHFSALMTAVSVEAVRGELMNRWERQMAVLGAPSLAALGGAIEEAAEQFVPAIRSCLDWREKNLGPLVTKLKGLGFDWDAFVNSQPANLSPNGDLLRIAKGVSSELPRILEARVNAIRWVRLQAKLDGLYHRLSLVSVDRSSAEVVDRLREAVRQPSAESYARAFRRLVELHRLHASLLERRESLTKLERVAPAWAAALRDRHGIHERGELPGDPGAAWLWRQLSDELERRAAVSAHDLQDEITRQTSVLHQITVDLIDRLAWAAQVKRTTLPQRQALVGWLNTVRKIGRGHGRMVPKLRVEAARKMTEARSAVPVWIMPLSRVAEQFDPRSTRFDLVIIDEASQTDAMGLVALYLGRTVLIVGDHEQVSPEAVGQDLEVVHRLIGEFLEGIPNAILYDGRRSIYDIAWESFGGMIVLLEHFRCVPEIIGFSNWLSYNGRIKPLRDPSDVLLKPHVVCHRVEGSRSTNAVNQAEALAIASLLVAATRMPEYAGKTFGVVSLVGEDQALEIDRLLRRYLSPDEYERRRVLCGTAAQFQGDERNVMFLSLVDAPQDGPLSLRQEDRFKQRFNVAASRAQDQMWIVHSLSPDVDLKPGDLRRRLIEYAQDPGTITRMLEREEFRAQSDLEKGVIRRLAAAGYRVHAQWQVGYYRIDIVIEGGDRRLAVECDGDRYHPIEKLSEDMARQAILERLNWRFVRIRGSQFFRDPDEAVKPLFERLESIGILPERDANSEVAIGEGDSLKSRVIRCATEIQQEWRERDDLGSLFAVGNTSARGRSYQRLGTPLPASKPEAQAHQGDAPALPDNASPGPNLTDSTDKLQKVDSQRLHESRPDVDQEDNGAVEWAVSIAPKVWFGMARWAKENNRLSPHERNFLFYMGRNIGSLTLSLRQS